MRLNTHLGAALAAAITAGTVLVPATADEADETAGPMRTSWGVPDLQGNWDFRTITPFQRPEDLADREFLTAEEVGEREARAADRKAERDVTPSPEADASQGDLDVGYNSIFIDTGTQASPHMRTSLVVDPPNGRVPARTRDALWRMAENRETWSRSPRTPADRPPATRCLIGFNAGPPMVSGAYNNMMKLVQGPGYVAILNEMVNDHRIIPTGGGEAAPEHMRFWQGDSVGRWEGDKLVVETTNFRPETNFNGSGKNMHLTEKFSRVDADTLRYEYTVNDPDSFEAPFSVIHDMRRTDDDVYEYACHEGNVAMHLMLSGAREQERENPDAVDDTWLPSWYKGLPKKEDLLAAAAEAEEGSADEGD